MKRKSLLPRYTKGLAKGVVVKVWEHVPPYIPTEQPLLGFIGEAPSNIERLKGVPLCGPSGQVFNQLLRTAGIERDAVYIDNVFDEQLPDNDIKNWCASSEERKGWDGYTLEKIEGNGYLRPEHTWHLQRLTETLRKVQPRVIVPLGGTALWAFTGTNAISVARGAAGEAKLLVPGAVVLPTYHPEFIRNAYKYFTTVVADIRKALELAGGKADAVETGEAFTSHELWLDPSLADMRHFKQVYIDTADELAVDIETGWGQITKVGIGVDKHRAIVVPFTDRRQPTRSYWPTVEEELAAVDWLESVLTNDTPKVMQNGLYDWYWLYEQWGIAVRNYSQDTRLLHHALYPELPKDLGYMGATYTNNRAWKLMREKKGEKRDE